MNPLKLIHKEIDRLCMKNGTPPKSLYIGWQDWQMLCDWAAHNVDLKPIKENYAESVCGLKVYIVKNDSHHFFVV